MSIRDKYFFTNLFSKSNIKITDGGFNANIDFSFLGRKIDRAQDAMKMQLVQDMLKYVPEGNGEGGGSLYNDILQYNLNNGERDVVYAYNPNGVPYGHYQNTGVLYVDPETGKGSFYSKQYGHWSRPGVQKVPTTRLLKYQKPEARRDWLRYAAEHDRDDVVRAAKEAFRKG